MTRRHIIGAAAAVLLAAGAGLGGGIALASASDPNGVTVCYANQQLLTGGGTWINGGTGSGDKELYHPDFNTSGSTDGHGMVVLSGGSNQGDC